ncbi:efflux RND transporter permease subunit [Engelhardtia mirabilis]|uniref:Toluene efflux pump membrane transporter TtgE n=1 Tax=Engelhardtia mirabilis TaxID=2528011 RepID=A0A518BPZ0_9BACT|nr:Toluene efflux pump membrane transporter TtgE [Planctomycetes bacterium Pla133]QDV03365.1 Toluene efflux pump membrane transporter TtgE [Planctomycetes bacterium Pla86]
MSDSEVPAPERSDSQRSEPQGAALAGSSEQGSPQDGDGFFGFTVLRPIGLLVAFVTLLVVGLISYQRIPLQLMPSGFAAQRLWVWVPNPGASARENEEKVARVIEEQLRTLPGIDTVRSDSTEDLVQIRINFDASQPIDLMKAEVRDRLERARPNLPSTVEDIGTWSEDADQLPISWFGILHPGDSDRTDFLLNEVVIPRLESIEGVSKIDVWGDLADSVRVLLDEDRVRAANIDIGDLIGRLSRDNFAQPLGEIDDGGRHFLLRADSRFKSLEEIERYPIGNGQTLADLGEVIKAKSVRDQLSRIDGNYSYFGVAQKESQANAVDASRALVAAFKELEQDPRLAGEISFLPFFVQGELIENSLAQLRATALWGGGLALLVLLVFLRRLRLTLCVALSIPVSALLAIAFEFFSGGSFNLLTMVGITLGIGMLVDNSVVVVENIARRRNDGEDGLRAAVTGAREIALAVTLATMTTVVVFLPIIFMSDDPRARVLFGGIGIPLSVSLISSLFVAVVFLPVVAARVLGDRAPWVDRILAPVAAVGRVPARLTGLLVGGLRWVALQVTRALYALMGVVLSLLAPRRFPLVGYLVRGAIALAVVWIAVPSAHRQLEGVAGVGALPGGKQAFQVAPPATAYVLGGLFALGLIALPPLLRRRGRSAPRRPVQLVPRYDSLLDLTREGQRRVVAWALRNRAASVVLALGSMLTIVIPFSGIGLEALTEEQNTDSIGYDLDFDTDFTLAEASDEVAIHERFLDEIKPELGFDHWSTRFSERGADVEVYWDEPVQPSERKALERRMKELVPRPPGHIVTFFDSERDVDFSSDFAAFELRGPDSRVLADLGVEAKRLLEAVPGLGVVKGPLDDSPNQLQIGIDRDMALSMGVNSEIAMNTIAWTLRGWPLPRYQEEGREVPFLIEFDQDEVAGLSTVKDLQVFNGETSVPLASFSALTFEPAPRRIRRIDGQTTFTLTAEVEDTLRLTELTERGYEALAALELPRGYRLGTENSARARQQDEAAEMQRALLLSIVLVFLLMGILFESVTLPFSVLVTIPYSMLGAIWTLYLTGTPMDMLGWIGLIILAGVVVNNGIVLIDRIHRLRQEYGDARRDEAIVDGAAQRVRPILMTALTTVFGLMPMILAEAATDAIDYRALATIVAGGLAASTFFTLWVVPLAYSLIDDVEVATRRGVSWALTRGSRTAPGPEGPQGAELSGTL